MSLKLSNVDRWLGAAGLTLACTSAALPWHVWTHPERYAPPRIAFERLDDDPAIAAFLPHRAEAPLVTGSVAVAERTDPVIVFASATHALARLPGAADLTLLRPGSALGDGESVTRIALADGRWTVVTSAGRALPVGR